MLHPTYPLSVPIHGMSDLKTLWVWIRYGMIRSELGWVECALGRNRLDWQSGLGQS